MAACAPRPPQPSAPAAAPQARKLLGVAAPYESLSLTDDERQLVLMDQVVRRARAWQVVANLLKPVPLAGGGSVPMWATWYGTDDIQRLFHKLYGDIGPAGRRVRQPFSDAGIDGAFDWNATMLDTLPSWPATRYEEWRGTLDGASRYHSLAGLSRTLYAPQATRHLLNNYLGVKDCAPAADAAPFEQLGRSAENFSLCFNDEFPDDAAIVKTAFRRNDFGFQLPVFDTDAHTLAAKQADPVGSWGAGDRQADPGEDLIYTLKLDGGASYRLAGLHVMTKDLREWMWITLWWSDKPDEDFGADRPDTLAALGAPWNQYKMCVVTGFTADPAGGPVIDDDNAGSWCSNPYLEAGASNHISNCMGCHQHGGTTIASEVVLSGAPRFPALGRQRTRENFPADYLWSVSRDPERLGPWIADVVTHYDLHDPASDGE